MDSNKKINQPLTSELVFSDFLRVLLRRSYIIAAVTLIAASAVFIYLKFLAPPRYTATASLYINILGEDDKAGTSSISSASAVAGDYSYLIKSKKVIGQILNAFPESGETYESITEKIKISLPIPHAVEISVTDRDPVYCVAVANELSRSAKQILPEFTSIDLKEIDPATLPESPDSNNVIKFTVLAAIIGAAVSSLGIITVFLLDDRIKNTYDIENRLGLSVLGIIPEIRTVSDKKSSLKNKKRTAAS